MKSKTRPLIVSLLAIASIIVILGLFVSITNSSMFLNITGVVTFFLVLSLPLTCLILRGTTIARQRKTRELEGRVHRVRMYESTTEMSTQEGAGYIVPIECPHCGAPVQMDRVSWIDSTSMQCPECLQTINIKIDEGV